MADSKDRHCFVLGAGFTCAYSEKAPTMQTFLQKAKEARIYDPSDLHLRLATVARRFFGSDTCKDFEALATFLSARTLPYPDQEIEYRVAAYDELITIIVRYLETLFLQPRSDETSSIFDLFAKYLVENETHVITLNYDVVLEELLRKNSNWIAKTGYGVDIPIAGPEDRQYEYNLAKVQVLKLHGSLNWGKRFVPREDGTWPVELNPFGARDKNKQIRAMSGLATNEIDAPVSHYWRPYIVPPLLYKAFDSSSDPLLANIWYRARSILAACDVIHILGYSLPASDIQFEILLREALHGLIDKPRRIVFVNLDPKADERVRQYGSTNVEVDDSKHDILAYLRILIAT